MIAVFYDRKNKCEVSSEQLMEINLIENYASIDNEGFPKGTTIRELVDTYGVGCVVIGERKIADFGYKSKTCPKIQNWDNFCNISDLVLLRFEDKQ